MATMRAARCAQFGPPHEVVEVTDVLVPEICPGEALVEVHAAAVNFHDLLLLDGSYQYSATPPFTPGSEYVGLVVDVADGESAVATGDAVLGLSLTGAFAEYAAGPAAALTRLPEGLAPTDAAGIGVAYVTAYQALRTVAEVARDEWVLVLGAAGGVGLAAVELAQVLGARVIAAASTPEKLELCRRRGATATIDYATEDLKACVREITGGAGADVVIDPVGGEVTEPALRATRWGGRYIVLGFAAGEIPRIPLNLLLLKGVVVRGFDNLGLATAMPDEERRGREELLELVASGRVRPWVSAVYPLADVPDALHALASRRTTGKLLIDPRRAQ